MLSKTTHKAIPLWVVAFLCILTLCTEVSAQNVGWPSLSNPPTPDTLEGQHDVVVIVAPQDYVYLQDIPGSEQNARDWVQFFEKTRGVPSSRIYRLLGSSTAEPTHIQAKIIRRLQAFQALSMLSLLPAMMTSSSSS